MRNHLKHTVVGEVLGNLVLEGKHAEDKHELEVHGDALELCSSLPKCREIVTFFTLVLTLLCIVVIRKS